MKSVMHQDIAAILTHLLLVVKMEQVSKCIKFADMPLGTPDKILTPMEVQEFSKKHDKCDLRVQQQGYTHIVPGSFSEFGKHCSGFASLDLTGNYLTKFDSNTWKDIVYTKDLYLTGNKISVLPHHGFEYFQKQKQGLRNLELGNNKIDFVEHGAFRGLKYLILLSLGCNKLTFLQQGQFLDLIKLKSLDLSRNQINLIEKGSFSEMPRLKYLYLHHNRMASVSPDMFQSHTRGKGIALEIFTTGNPLECNNACLIKQFFDAKSDFKLMQPKCKSIKSDVFVSLFNLTMDCQTGFCLF